MLAFEQNVVRVAEAEPSAETRCAQKHRPPIRGLYAKKTVAKGDVLASFSLSHCLTGRTAHAYLAQFAPYLASKVGAVASKIQDRLNAERQKEGNAAAEEFLNGSGEARLKMQQDTQAAGGQELTTGVYGEEDNSCRTKREGFKLTFSEDFPQYSVSRDSVAMFLAVGLIKRQREAEVPTSAAFQHHSLYKWVSAWPKAIPPFDAVVADGVQNEESLVSAVLRNSPADAIRFKEGSAHEDNVANDSFTGQLNTIERRQQMLKEVVLEVLAEVLEPSPSGPTSPDFCAARLAAEWAHFMVRSRSVRLDASRSGEVGVVPVLDMVNHSNKPNVTYSVKAPAQAQQQDAKAHHTVSISATRKILPGEQLTVNYGDLVQRGLLFGFDFPSQFALDAPKYANHELDALQDEQRYKEITDTSNEKYVHKEAEEVMRIIMDRHDLWMWNFGFSKSKSEREDDSGFRWSKGVHARSSKLLERTERFGPKGKKGEFIVGVPEGLQHLKAARERLTDYYGKPVHPLTPGELENSRRAGRGPRLGK